MYPTHPPAARRAAHLVSARRAAHLVSARRAAHLAPALCALVVTLAAVPADAATPAELLGGYAREAATSPDPARGQRFFAQRHGRDWSCSSCHGTTPTQEGRHASTGKSIAALAPGFNAQRFTDAAKTEKWFRRNCNDVVGRECTAGEKADVLAWLSTLQP